MKRKGMGFLKFEIVPRALERFRVGILERIKCLFGLGKRILGYIFVSKFGNWGKRC